MIDESRNRITVPVNKGDIQNCSNYRGIKFMHHTLKVWERVTKHRLQCNSKVSKNKFDFLPGISSMDPLTCLGY